MVVGTEGFSGRVKGSYLEGAAGHLAIGTSNPYCELYLPFDGGPTLATVLPNGRQASLGD